ncbi:MAG: heavy metal translocating P-type ATPase metal-binding domain-containing protein [Bacteroidetes bacterium]|nr:heavy metal translocating P-type ATPase metal-binding domain-containing protein [Bacteroidota bacterium]MBI3481853.1 heavy metal translocating P-type ATPase metal-binding domain-containing protein [Bacteroidota bacterium]
MPDLDLQAEERINRSLNIVEEIATEKERAIQTICFHCGQNCEETHWLDEKVFCCYGCKTVYEILNANDLCEYYQLDNHPGISLRNIDDKNFLYLDEEPIRKKLTTFDSEDFAKITFAIPSIHCVSCIWLLENLQKIDHGVLRAEVNFVGKSVAIEFVPDRIKLSKLAGLLSSLGYAPQINLDADGKINRALTNPIVFKLAVAGFCFGNVMLFSFPEYLGLDQTDPFLIRIFSFLNLALAVPVFFYSGFDYLRSAAKSFKQRQINIDVPIAAGLIALFFRSAFDIMTNTGSGYLDSFTGLVFFLLIGRWFQSKTYESLAFDRDFKSYFPLAVQRMVNNEWRSVIIYHLSPGDLIQIRNMEIIPADSTLVDDYAFIDYSFVTGESRPVKPKQGDKIYAGGRLIGQPIQLIIEKSTSQSQLTSLWNNPAFGKANESKYKKIIDQSARAFTWVVLVIAVITAVYWRFTNSSQMWLVLTSVLMVACPCALALAAPFTYGNMMRVFGRNQFYLKNADVIERIAAIDSIVFDKTGTVTHGNKPKVEFCGKLSDEELGVIKLLTGSSTHPLSIMIAQSINKISNEKILEFKEMPNKGIQGIVNGHFIKIGSPEFVDATHLSDSQGSNVFVSIDGEVIGYFHIQTSLRKNIKGMIDRLGKKCDALLSGDTENDASAMKSLFTDHTLLFFNKSPHDKLEYIHNLQQHGKTVLMVGDGLNDSGALKQSDVGIAITDNVGVFTPACDGILNGHKLSSLDKFISLAKSSTVILKSAFVISFLYNAVALGFAVTGNLTPLTAAVLMPLSSISVVGFSSIAVNTVAKHKLK